MNIYVKIVILVLVSIMAGVILNKVLNGEAINTSELLVTFLVILIVSVLAALFVYYIDKRNSK